MDGNFCWPNEGLLQFQPALTGEGCIGDIVRLYLAGHESTACPRNSIGLDRDVRNHCFILQLTDDMAWVDIWCALVGHCERRRRVNWL